MFRLLAAVLLGASLAAAEVKVLTEKDFDATVDGSKFVFVKFYAPWCGHCKKMAPDWEKLSNEVDANQAVIAEVDCTKNDPLCKRFEVRGYPTLKHFAKGATTPEEYEGERGYDDLLSFVKEQFGGCDVETKEGCTAEESEYITKMKGKSADEIKKELEFLTSIKDKRARTADQTTWYKTRVKLLKKLL